MSMRPPQARLPIYLLVAVFIGCVNIMMLRTFNWSRDLSLVSFDMPNVARSSDFQSFSSWRNETDSRRDTLRNHTAAICCVAKDEEAYIDEWVDYNLALGFDTIYVYDNSDGNDLRQWGARRGERVQVRHYNGTGQQMKAYLDCLQYLQEKHTYAAFFDVDEFLVMRNHTHVVDLLDEYLPNGGSLAIGWRLFTSDDKDAYSPEPVTKRFLHRLPDDYDDQSIHIKSIVKLSDVEHRSPRDPHHFFIKEGKNQTDTNGHLFTGPRNPDGPLDVAFLHHYRYKSFNEFVHKRCVRKRASVGPDVEQGYLCDEALARSHPRGTIYDNTVWEKLKELVPPYRVFD